MKRNKNPSNYTLTKNRKGYMVFIIRREKIKICFIRIIFSYQIVTYDNLFQDKYNFLKVCYYLNEKTRQNVYILLFN